MNALSVQDIITLLEIVCWRKSTCAFCGDTIWFVRNTRTKKLLAYDTSGRDHFATNHVEPKR